MARVVDYLPFAINVGSNVEGQSSYVIEPIRLTGHQAGVAKSAVINKSLRQHSVMVAALGNLLSEALDVDVLDDGDVDALKNMLQDVLMGGRSTILTADVTFYVRANGSDNNDGLTPTSAFATPQHAVDHAYNTLQLNGFALTIDIGTGTFPEIVMVSPLVGQRGGWAVWLAGAGKGSTTLSSPRPTIHTTDGAACTVSGLRMVSMGGTGWGDGSCLMSHYATIQGFDLDFGPCELGNTPGSGVFSQQIHSSLSSLIQFGDVDKDYYYNISGGGAMFAAATAGSLVQFWNSKFTLTGTPNYTSSFVEAHAGSTIAPNQVSGSVGSGTGTAFSGAATGARFFVDGTSTVYTNARDADPNYYPGSAVGYVVNNNAQLNYL